MNDRDSAYSNMFDMAIQLANGGVDLSKASETVNDAVLALNKQAKALATAEYSSDKEKRVSCPECKTTFSVALPDHTSLSKTMANTAKVIDETARLVHFTAGRPDSRPDGGAGLPTDVLKALTNEQLAILTSWLESNERTAAE